MIIGVDIGTTNIKAGAVINGRYYWSKYGYATDYRDNMAEQDPAEYIRGTVHCLKDLLAQIQAQIGRRMRPAALVFSGHAPSLVCVDRYGNPLGKAIIWQDQRATEAAHQISTLLGETVFASSNEAKILWMKDHQPDLYRAAHKFLQPKDYVICCLTGRFLIDESAASTMIGYSRTQKDFAPIGRIGIDPCKMPEVVPSEMAMGGVAGNYADELGIDENTRIVVGGIDAFCEALGCGIYEGHQIGETTGTSTCVFSCSDGSSADEGADAVADARIRVDSSGRAAAGDSGLGGAHLPDHVIDGKKINVLPLSYSGGTIAWFINSVMQQSMDSSTLSALEDTLLKTTPAGGPVFIPYIMGARSPYWDDHATGSFIGLTKDDNLQTMYRSVLEGLAYDLRQNIELLDENGRSRSVMATGGGNSNDGWLQIKADVCNRDFCRTRYGDGAIIGDIILGEYSVNQHTVQSAVDQYVAVSKTFKPRPEYAEAYQCKYTLFKEMCGFLQRGR